MLPLFNRKESQNSQHEELVNTLGNPHASEEEWLNASDKLGEYKPKPTATEQRHKVSRHLGEVSMLAAMGLGIFALINLSQPSNVHSVAPAPVKQAPVVDVDFGPYMANLQRNIKRSWFPPQRQESRRVVVRFNIDRGGELSNLKVLKSCGVAVADQAAINAVENAAPNFKPLPAGAPPEVTIEFTFDYNVLYGPNRENTSSTSSSKD
ncbi:MAG: TonB C-terminal domain-containing protein [Cyanobacteria bacterium SZAS LIN-5]|nr:TonB C-terminal domain-containing protein [Cyanobacteria bacterium SZAS LIN-5]